jgi:hypothetical protein
LPHDLEPVQREEHDLADANDGPRRRAHHGLAVLLAKGRRELALVVGGQEVVDERLPAELVNALQNLVAGCVAEPGEESGGPRWAGARMRAGDSRKELLGDWRMGMLAKDDVSDRYRFVLALV